MVSFHGCRIFWSRPYRCPCWVLRLEHPGLAGAVGAGLIHPVGLSCWTRMFGRGTGVVNVRWKSQGGNLRFGFGLFLAHCGEIPKAFCGLFEDRLDGWGERYGLVLCLWVVICEGVEHWDDAGAGDCPEMGYHIDKESGSPFLVSLGLFDQFVCVHVVEFGAAEAADDVACGVLRVDGPLSAGVMQFDVADCQEGVIAGCFPFSACWSGFFMIRRLVFMSVVQPPSAYGESEIPADFADCGEEVPRCDDWRSVVRGERP